MIVHRIVLFAGFLISIGRPTDMPTRHHDNTRMSASATCQRWLLFRTQDVVSVAGDYRHLYVYGPALNLGCTLRSEQSDDQVQGTVQNAVREALAETFEKQIVEWFDGGFWVTEGCQAFTTEACRYWSKEPQAEAAKGSVIIWLMNAPRVAESDARLVYKAESGDRPPGACGTIYDKLRRLGWEISISCQRSGER